MMIKRKGVEVQTQPQTGSSPSKEGSTHPTGVSGYTDGKAPVSLTVDGPVLNVWFRDRPQPRDLGQVTLPPEL